MMGIWEEFIGAITNNKPSELAWVVLGFFATAAVILKLKGRAWAFLYVVLIPFLNWTFGKGQLLEIDISSVLGFLGEKVVFQPLTLLTGMVFVVRDFVQREMGQRVLILMAIAVAWSFYYSWPVIALVSAIAFAISETADWLLYTYTKYRLSTRILLSSAVAAPLDTTIFLYGADLARQMAQGDPPGNTLTLANWIFFIIGKMIGAVVVSRMIRAREDKGLVDPAAI